MGGEECYSAQVIVTFELPTGTRVTCDEKTAAVLGWRGDSQPEPEDAQPAEGTTGTPEEKPAGNPKKK